MNLVEFGFHSNICYVIKSEYWITVIQDPNSKMATNGDGGKVEDPALLEMQKLVKDAFSIFDHENNDTVDMREVGTIIRCELV